MAKLMGLRWMGNLHASGLSGILADEMGLGKTLQTIAFLTHLHSNDGSKSLIVIPLSLMMNWKSEWESFAPGIRVSFLQGDANERREAKDAALKSSSTQILITTYEIANREIEFLSAQEWNFLVVDEGHRLKNPDSLLHRNLSMLQCKGRLLLTGIRHFHSFEDPY